MTESIQLTLFSTEHIDQTYQWLCNEELRQQIDSLGIPDQKKNRLYWQNKIDDKKSRTFAISQGELHIGNCGLNQIDLARKKAELWIYLGKKVEAGLGSLALQKLLRFGFGELGLHKIYLRVVENNIRAQKLYEKFGFQREGVARDNTLVDGRFINAILYSLLESEFKEM